MLLFTLPMAEQKKPGPTQTETAEHIETGAVSPRLAPVGALEAPLRDDND